MVYFQRLTPIDYIIYFIIILDYYLVLYYHEYKETKRILYETDSIVHLAIWPTNFWYAEGGKGSVPRGTMPKVPPPGCQV